MWPQIDFFQCPHQIFIVFCVLKKMSTICDVTGQNQACRHLSFARNPVLSYFIGNFFYTM